MRSRKFSFWHRSAVRLCCGLLFVILSVPSRAQERILQELFERDEVLTLDIETDLRQLIRGRREENYLNARLTAVEDSDSTQVDIRIRPRGNFRRETCGFPPLMLDFRKAKTIPDGPGLPFARLKLVNPCQVQATSEQYVLREYLIYRCFDLLCDKGFRTRLVRVRYDDSQGQQKSIQVYGFLLEEEEQMARRLDAVIVRSKGLSDRDVVEEHMRMLSVFEFMIGNTDWQMERLQNLVLFKINDPLQPKPYAVPYDFDFTGMVDAHYAIPAPVLELSNIRERKYWGKCYPEEEMRATVEYFLERKEDIYALYRDFGLFSKASAGWSANYLDSFFGILENEKAWKRHFIENCRP
jgi:hypothetical protein